MFFCKNRAWYPKPQCTDCLPSNFEQARYLRGRAAEVVGVPREIVLTSEGEFVFDAKVHAQCRKEGRIIELGIVVPMRKAKKAGLNLAPGDWVKVRLRKYRMQEG